MDNPNIRIPPPLIFLLFILTGLGLDHFYPIPLLNGPIKWILFFTLLFLSLSIAGLSIYLFKKNKTEVIPWKPASFLVVDGPYKYSRNPMYFSFVLFGIALSFVFSNGWILISMIPFALVIDKMVIAKEEEYLKRRFGQKYLDYLKKVRRWI